MTTKKKAATHEEAREALEAVALDALELEERLAVLAHVESCAECSAELASLRETVASLALVAATPEHGLSPDRSAAVRDRLLSRARADHGSSRVDRGGKVVSLAPRIAARN